MTEVLIERRIPTGLGRLSALDRILSVEVGVGATALRNVTQTLAIFDTHFPLKPVLPGVLVLGSMAELAKVLLTEQTGDQWRLVGADRVRYRHFIQPGDQMEIAVKLTELDGDLARLAATVKVDGRLATSATAVRMARATSATAARKAGATGAAAVRMAGATGAAAVRMARAAQDGRTA